MASSSSNSAPSPVGATALRAESSEVYYSDAPVVAVSEADINALKKIACGNPRLRSRLCAHPAPASAMHDMLIVHHRDVYVRPHMHVGKDESFHLIEGDVLVVFYNNDGSIRDVMNMGGYGTGKPFFYRIPEQVFHTLVITSEWLTFHETTSGPFDPAHTRFAEWAPDGTNAAVAARYVDQIKQNASLFLKSRAG